jgi:hypothetical protein
MQGLLSGGRVCAHCLCGGTAREGGPLSMQRCIDLLPGRARASSAAACGASRGVAWRGSEVPQTPSAWGRGHRWQGGARCTASAFCVAGPCMLLLGCSPGLQPGHGELTSQVEPTAWPRGSTGADSSAATASSSGRACRLAQRGVAMRLPLRGAELGNTAQGGPLARAGA